MTQEEKLAVMRERRDRKTHDHLEQYAPVWMVDEVPIFSRDAIQFNVVFKHPRYGWVNRRYQYDAFNDVLYHQGQHTVSEEEVLRLEEQTPYIDAEMINTVESYGG